MLDSEQLKIVNNRGETYLLHPNYSEFGVLAIEGLSLPDVTVNISESGTTDGGKFNSAHIGVRPIVIHLVMFGWTESERKKLYRMFPAKSAVELYYRNTQYNVKTTGYVKHIDPVPYYDKTRVRIELTCPDPYLHDVDGITSETTGNPPAATLVNTAECEIGFTAEVSIDTDELPTLKRTITQSETADYLRQHFLWWNWGAFNTFDPDTMSLNIYLNDVYQVPETDYTYDLLTVVYTDMWLTFPNGTLSPNRKITAEILVVEGQSFNHLRRYTSSIKTTGTQIDVLFTGQPMVDTEDQIHVYYDGTQQTIGVSGDCEISIIPTGRNTDFWIRVQYKHAVSSDKTTEVEIYSDESGADVSSLTINRYTTSLNLNAYVDAILDPDLGGYDSSKDILWVDMGDTRLTDSDYELVTATSQIDNETHTMLMMKNGGRVSRQLTLTRISSTENLDIREYDEDDIDNGLLLVRNLSLTNRATWESMSFPDIAFQKGDKFTISTVPGSISVTVTQSDWMPVGKSLLSEVIRNGTFFKIVPGENNLRFGADVNFTFISGTFNIEQLYGGV
jgi:hypothetical protein